MVTVLFVCLGNICRSPMAEAIFRHKVERAGLSKQFHIDSAGTGDWHIGNPPHEGTRNILDEKGIVYDGIKARQIEIKDLKQFNYIVAMDDKNIKDIQTLEHPNSAQVLKMLSFMEKSPQNDVPDPYFTGNFQEVYDLLSHSCEGLLHFIREKENL
ncbi:low molecular weight protein-tyrosine-phosphatase [Longirhabdus pacifica]|uniref:low molecular weight protein-tyrosine-phosphatase n=1 Tax=Longirhabdus pacifica TaxID=2305227 RepID=UPI0010087C51|nr:low molecular weight protein-tyrosine-phosphatase [Longirhabdus pacifica]